MAPIETSTPKRSNDDSVIIISPPRPKRRIIPLQIATNSKTRKKEKNVFMENLYLKYFEETVCVFTAEQILPNLKKKNCRGCKNISIHECILSSNEEWVLFYYGEIIEQLDIKLIKALCKQRLYEHFRPAEVENTIKAELLYRTNDQWAEKVKTKIINFVTNLENSF